MPLLLLLTINKQFLNAVKSEPQKNEHLSHFWQPVKGVSFDRPRAEGFGS